MVSAAAMEGCLVAMPAEFEMRTPEYKQAVALMFEKVTADHPKLTLKKRWRMAEALARQFVVELKLGLIKP